MNIDAQFPQPLAPPLSQRPLDKPVEQTTTRPVDNPRPSDGATDKPQRETAKTTRNEDRKTSGQDRSVAAQATQMESEARSELLESGSSTSETGRTAPASPANRIQNASTEPAPVGDLLDVIV